MPAEIKKFLSRDELLALPDLTTEDVFVPEWDATVRVRSLTAKERDKFEADSVKRKGKNFEADLRNLRARLVCLTVVDENGKRLFSDADADAIGAKNAAAVNLLFDTARRLSGMSKEDVEDLEVQLKNDLSDDSTTD